MTIIQNLYVLVLLNIILSRSIMGRKLKKSQNLYEYWKLKLIEFVLWSPSMIYIFFIVEEIPDQFALINHFKAVYIGLILVALYQIEAHQFVEKNKIIESTNEKD